MHWRVPPKCLPVGWSSENSNVALNIQLDACDMTPNLKRLQLSKPEEELDGDVCISEYVKLTSLNHCQIDFSRTY